MGSLKIGPVGKLRSGSEKWDHQGRTKIVQILISYNSKWIKSLQFQYLENDRLHTSEIIGCQDFSGSMFDTITFEGTHEYITKVEGFYSYDNVEKLCIHTNIKMYGIFEAEDQPKGSFEEESIINRSIRFSFNFGEGNQFGGFHGTHSSQGLCSIGVYFSRLAALPATYINNDIQRRSINTPFSFG